MTYEIITDQPVGLHTFYLCILMRTFQSCSRLVSFFKCVEI